jgi:plasmid stability protein
MTNMHVRDVPDSVHSELQRRADAAGMTLRAYTIQVLSDHCATTPVTEWIDRIARRRAASLTTISGARAVAMGRDDSWAGDGKPA